MARISAIVTCYNVEAYVATAMQSVVDAGFDDLELIVVDDGSSDMTRPVIEAVGTTLPAHVEFRPVFFSRNTPGGVATAANAGLDMATGEVVVFIDGDDWVIPHALAEAVRRLLAGDRDILVADCQEYWNTTGNYTRYPEGMHWQALAEGLPLEAQRQILLRMAPFPWRKIYRRSFLERHRIRFPTGPFMFEDNPFHWEVTLKADRFGFFREVTHVHRMDRPGQSITGVGEKSLRIFDHYDIIRDMLGGAPAMAALTLDDALRVKAEPTASGAAADPLPTARIELLRWLLNHVLWCSDRVPATRLNQAYDMARARMLGLDPGLVWEVMTWLPLSARSVRRLTAIMLDDRMAYLADAELPVQTIS